MSEHSPTSSSVSSSEAPRQPVTAAEIRERLDRDVMIYETIRGVRMMISCDEEATGLYAWRDGVDGMSQIEFGEDGEDETYERIARWINSDGAEGNAYSEPPASLAGTPEQTPGAKPLPKWIASRLIRDLTHALDAEAEMFKPGRMHHNGPRRIEITINVQDAKLLLGHLSATPASSDVLTPSQIDARFISAIRRAFNTTKDGDELRTRIGDAITELHHARAALPPNDGPKLIRSIAEDTGTRDAETVKLDKHERQELEFRFGESVAKALNQAWNDYTGDTGCYPSCLSISRNRKGIYVEADFRLSNFALFTAGWLLCNHPELIPALRSAHSPESSPAVDAGTTDAGSSLSPDGEKHLALVLAMTPSFIPGIVEEFAHEIARLRAQLAARSRPAVDDETVKLSRDLARAVGEYRGWANGSTRATTIAAIGAEAMTHLDTIARACDALTDAIYAARRSPDSVPEANNG